MPIRINLLAEEQAAEEMRRRDPIKRAIFAGAALTALMLGWIGITQMNVMAARRELADHTARLQKVEDSSKEVRTHQVAVGDFQNKAKALEKYSRNRFYWGTLLDAVQQLTVDSVRLMEIKSEQRYSAADPHKFFSTNLTVGFVAPPPRWKFWASAPNQPSLQTLASNALATVTNVAPFATNRLPYNLTISPVSTNAAERQAVAKVEFTNPSWAGEKTIVEIRGRDYGTPPGAAVDEFARRLTSSPYFKELLVPVEGFKFTERPPQPRPDPSDPVNPDAFFVPFTIELTLKERILTNE
jgi:hypothetical protein